MDPQTITMVAQLAIGLLSPYLAKAGETVASKVGENIYSLLKSRFAKRPIAQEALADLKNAPNDPDTQAALRLQLKKLLEEDAAFAKELQGLLKEAETANTINIVQQSAGDNAQQFGQVTGNITFD